jgi:glutamate/tyrosine decarboxylase-like PLP-dependent enzyme
MENIERTANGGDWQTLALDPEEFKRLAHQVVDLIGEQLAQPGMRPPLPPALTPAEAESRVHRQISPEGISGEKLIEWVRQEVLPFNENLHHPLYLGWILSSSSPVGALAEFIVAALNLVNNAWVANPVLTTLEFTVLKYFGELTGFGKDASGILVSGGSMANLTALAAARAWKAGRGVRNTGMKGREKQLTGYASHQAHFCIDRSFEMLGIGLDYLRKIEVDQDYRIDLAKLEAAIQEDLRNGYEPFLIVGNAGTTNTGAIDPLPELAALAKRYNLWFHVDGAYGGFSAVSPKAHPLFAGLEQADSLAIDPHKWLFIPVEAGCTLVRDQNTLKEAFEQTAGYVETVNQGHNIYEYGFQLTRMDRSLKIYMALQYHGLDRFAAVIEQNMELIRYLGRMAEEAPDFELISKPQLSIVCFRYTPADLKGQPEANPYVNFLNRKLEEKLIEGGKVLVSSTRLSGKFTLRACLVNYHTTPQDMEFLFNTVRANGEALDQEFRDKFVAEEENEETEK